MGKPNVQDSSPMEGEASRAVGRREEILAIAPGLGTSKKWWSVCPVTLDAQEMPLNLCRWDTKRLAHYMLRDILHSKTNKKALMTNDNR